MRTVNKSSSVEERTSYSSLKQVIVSAIVALCAGLVAGVPTPVELFGDRVLKLMSAGQFVGFLIRFGSHAKTAPLGLALLGMIGLGSALGLLYAIIVRIKLPASGYRPARGEWLAAG